MQCQDGRILEERSILEENSLVESSMDHMVVANENSFYNKEDLES